MKRRSSTAELNKISAATERQVYDSESEFDSDDSLKYPTWKRPASEDYSTYEYLSDVEAGDVIGFLNDLAIEEAEEEDEIVDEDDELSPENNNSPWTDYTGRQKTFPFTGQKDLQKAVPPDSTPLDILLLLVNDKVLNLIVSETNRFANQTVAAKQPKKYARINKWRETNAEEIKQFLGLITWMGLVKLSSLKDYWAKDGIYKQTIPQSVMARNRFQLLLSLLHFNDNDTIRTGDRLAKFQPLLDVLEQNFKELFCPGEDIVIDETLIPWRGRLIFRQYIPNKAHRYGIKLFKLCSVNGYTWGLKVYSGRSVTGEREVGLAKNICLNLAEQLLHQGRTLYIDNFYTSYELAKCFLDKKTHVVGTLRANKKDIPKDVLHAKLKRGDMISREDENGIVVLKWRDTRDVRMLTTKHAPVMAPVTVSPLLSQPTPSIDEPTTSRRSSRRVTEKPLPVLAYNSGKAGIDLSDQMASYVTTLRKGIKWYRKLGLELLLGISMVNAWVVYKHVTKKTIKIRTFREEVVKDLLQVRGSNEEPCVARSTSRIHHLVQRIDGEGKKMRRKCSACYAKMQRESGREVARKQAKMVYTYCSYCPGSPQMCLECFNLKH